METTENVNSDLPIASDRPLVMLAEDDPDQSEMLAEILSAEGFDVDTAYSGDTAWHKLSRNAYALVILDIQMPGMSGTEVLRRLRAAETTQHVPVIVVSAFATDHQLQKYRADGADECISKPYEINTLLTTIKRMAEERKHSN